MAGPKAAEGAWGAEGSPLEGVGVQAALSREQSLQRPNRPCLPQPGSKE